MKNRWILAALTALVILPAAPAMAQRLSGDSGFAARLGLFYPSATRVQQFGANWLSFGIDLKLRNLERSAESQSWLQYSIDIVQKQDFRSVPFTINYVSKNGQTYFFGGAGASLTKFRTSENEIRDQVKFAYQVGFGYELRGYSLPVFLELKWMGTTESDLNGWGVFLGARF